MPEQPESLTTEWPMTPRYSEWAGKELVGGWVAYKIKSAEWYIDRLEEVGGRVGFDRYVGVEMAMDGALAALCGAFDASVRGLVEAVDKYFKESPPEPALERFPEHLTTWKRCRDLRLSRLRSEAMDLDVDALIAEVDVALAAKKGEPLGWLAELQRLRNDAIHNNTLARHIDAVVGSDAVWGVTVGRTTLEDGALDREGRAENPVTYLREAQGRLTALTDSMVAIIDYLCPNGVPTERQGVTVGVPTLRAVARVPAPTVTVETPRT